MTTKKENNTQNNIQEEKKKIIKLLRKTGFGVKPNEGETINLTFEKGPLEEDEIEIFNIYPSIKWMKAIISNNDDILKKLWKNKHTPESDHFEDIISKFNYKLSCFGGGNFSYEKQYGKKTISFCWWGNPWHI